MSDSEQFILDVGYEQFEQEVIARSMRTPVLVDFWAAWCGPCKALTPVLEKLAHDYQGGFALVKVDTDAQPELAQAFQVQSLPSCKLVIDGRIVDEFMGALPEAELRTFLEKHLGPAGAASADGSEDAEPGPLEAARAALEAGDFAAARGHLAGIEGDSAEDAAARLLSAEVELAAGDSAAASQILEGLSEADAAKPEARRLSAQLALGTIDEGELARLESAFEAAPQDQGTRIEYARGLARAGFFGEALEHLIDSVRSDRSFDEEAARRAMVEVFDVLGPDDEMAHEYRRQLQMAMFV